MDVYYSADDIKPNKGDLIEFHRFMFFPIQMLTYFHFAVYTFDCNPNCGGDVQPANSIGDRYFKLTNF